MKDNNKILVVLVIILSVLVLVLGGYLFYDKVLSNNDVNGSDVNNDSYDNWMDYIMNSNINSIQLSYCIDNNVDDEGLPIRNTINITKKDLNRIFNEMKKGTITKKYYGDFAGPCTKSIDVNYISNNTAYQLLINDGYSIGTIVDPKILSHLENTNYSIENIGNETDLTKAPYTFEYDYNKAIINEIIDNYTK